MYVLTKRNTPGMEWPTWRFYSRFFSITYARKWCPVAKNWTGRPSLGFRIGPTGGYSLRRNCA